MGSTQSLAKIKEYISEGKRLKAEKRYAEAINQYLEALKLNPNSVPVLNQLAITYENINEFDQAINCLQRAVQLMPNHVITQARLAKVLMLNGSLEASIAAYKKVIALKPDLPSGVYQGFGDALVAKGCIDEAISAYQKAINLNPVLPHLISKKLGDALSKQGRLDEAINSYQKALQSQPNYIPAYMESINTYHKKGWLRFRFYSINHKHKIIYCMIPKNATTLFKNMMITNSDQRERYEKSNQGVHKYLRTNPQFKVTDPSYLRSPDYFKFVILRNPFNRLVSAYLDKFVKQKRAHGQPDRFVQNVIIDVYNYQGLEPDIDQSITFSQFIHYLERTEDVRLDPHWRPQVTFIGEGLFDFDFVGQFEKLDSVIEYLEKKFSFKIQQSILNPKQEVHITKYGKFNDDEKFYDKYPTDLRALENFPKARQLYTPELEKLVRSRYAKDIEIYEREFNVCLSL